MFKLIFIFAALLSSVHADDPHLEEAVLQELDAEPLFVSLGSYCEPAHVLRYANLRKAAFPFDWTISFDGEGLIALLEDNFAHFFDYSAFVPYGPAGHLLQTYYRLEFLHEGNFNGDGFNAKLAQLREKFTRRIARFRDLEHYPGKVFFIRQAFIYSMTDPHRYYHVPENVEISEEYALRLCIALKRRFSKLDFVLFVINHQESGVVVVEKKLSDQLLMIRTNTSGGNQARVAEFFNNLTRLF